MIKTKDIIKQSNNILERFKYDLLKEKYGETTVKKYAHKPASYITETIEEQEESFSEVKKVASLIAQKKIELSEGNFIEVLSFHMGNGWSVAHELAKNYGFVFEEKELLDLVDDEGITVESLVKENEFLNKQDGKD